MRNYKEKDIRAGKNRREHKERKHSLDVQMQSVSLPIG